jgi:hypothetical protein
MQETGPESSTFFMFSSTLSRFFMFSPRPAVVETVGIVEEGT